MKGFIILFVVFLSSCSTKIDTSFNVAPYPVIYSIINATDTMHIVYITKSFSGDGGPLVDALNPDSLYFKDVKVNLVFRTRTDSMRYEMRLDSTENKLPGIFHNPKNFYYSVISETLDKTEEWWCRFLIDIPGYRPITNLIRLIDPPKMIYPTTDGSMISLRPENPFTISWIGSSWNDLSISFILYTHKIEGTVVDTLTYKKNAIVIPVMGSFNFGMSFSFENFLALLNRYFTSNIGVLSRSFGPIYLKIDSADKNFFEYRRMLQREIDYVFFINSKPEPVFGVFASRSSRDVRDLEFDKNTLDFLCSDSSMTKFKFVKW